MSLHSIVYSEYSLILVQEFRGAFFKKSEGDPFSR